MLAIAGNDWITEECSWRAGSDRRMPLKEREKEHARAARFDADEAIKTLSSRPWRRVGGMRMSSRTVASQPIKAKRSPSGMLRQPASRTARPPTGMRRTRPSNHIEPER